MFRFRSSQPTTSDTSAFIGPEAISDVMLNEMMFESADHEVFRTMMDSMCAMYQATACGDMSIAREGLGDMAKSAWEWFKSIIKKIADFIKNAFNYLLSYVLDFEKFIDKYKENLNNFQEFEVSGYTYTIDGEPIDNYGIDKIVTQYNTNIDKIKDKEIADVQKMIRDELGKESIGEMRAKLCGKTGIVKPDKFVKEMEKKFRNGKGSKSTIKVNSGLVSGYIDEFKRYKELLSDVKEDGYNVQSVLTDMGEFFRGMPTYDYKDSNDKRIKKYKISADAKKGEVKTDEDGEESYSTDHYKKLTMYYNFCYRMCRDIAGVYTKAYTVKIAALKEAVSFYKTVIRRALSPFADKMKDKAESAVSSTKESVGIDPVMELFNSRFSESGDVPLTLAECREAAAELKKYSGRMTVIEPVTKLGIDNNIIGTFGFVGWSLGETEARKECRRITELATKKSKKYRFKIGSNINNVLASSPFHVRIYAFRKKDKESDTERNSIWLENLSSIYVSDVEDYSLTAMESMHEIEISEWDVYYEEYISEINIMAEAYRRGCVLMEDVEIKEKNAADGSGDSLFKKIIEFIRTIFAKFKDKASNLFNSNKEWFDKYSHKLENVKAESLNNMRITMLDYDRHSDYSKFPDCSISDPEKDARLGKDKAKTLEEIAKLMFPQLIRLSTTKDLAEGTKIYYRGETNKVKVYQGEGEIRPEIKKYCEYCENYLTETEKIQKLIDDMTEKMEKADTAYQSSKEASTSYVLAEGALVEDTGFAWLPWIDSNGDPKFLVLTEETAATTASGNSEKQEGKEAVKSTGAESVDGSGKNNSNDKKSEETEEQRKAREEQEKKAKDEQSAIKLAIKYYYQNKVKVATAMMTIAEERYAAYVKTLRNIVALAHIAADKSDNPDKKK